MLNLCITCDHEIFFGDNHLSENDILIKPTYELAELFENNNVRATFFTDVCSIFRYKSLNMIDYPNRMEEQLKELLRRGHDVQLHLHPHWYYSDYKNGQWRFEKTSYRLQSFGFNSSDSSNISAEKIIKDGKDYLETLLRPVDACYQCIAFRAGGLCLQPERELLKTLKKNDINIDSSVIQRCFTNKGVHYYSYQKPPETPNWWINPETGINCDAGYNMEQNLFEIPIGSFNKKPMLWILKRRGIYINCKEPSRGSYMTLSEAKNNFLTKFTARIKGFLFSPIIFDFDIINDDALIKVLREYMKKFDCINNDYFVSILCHPKTFRNAHMKNVDSFLKKVLDNVPLIKFTTLHNVYDKYLINYSEHAGLGNHR
jgi:hypothetical protein